MTLSSNKPVLAFTFEMVRPYGDEHAQVTIATIRDDSETPSYANEYNDLVVVAYPDRDFKRSGFYGYRVGSEARGRIELTEAQELVRRLTKIEKHMDRLAARFGRPQSLAQYLLHLGDALNVKRIGYIERTPNNRAKVTNWLPLAEGTSRIDDIEHSYRVNRDAA